MSWGGALAPPHIPPPRGQRPLDRRPFLAPQCSTQIDATEHEWSAVCVFMCIYVKVTLCHCFDRACTPTPGVLMAWDNVDIVTGHTWPTWSFINGI